LKLDELKAYKMSDQCDLAIDNMEGLFMSSIDLTAILDKIPISRFHYVMLIICILFYFFAAMNCVLIAPALDLIQKEFRLDPFLLGIVVGSLYLGMLLGAATCGYLSDAIGRKLALVITTTIHSIFTGLLALAWDFKSLVVLRFIAGYGLGGLLPLPGVYMSEYAPPRRRGLFIGLIETSWVFGALLAASLGLVIIPRYGWRVLFYTAFIPLAIIPPALAYLPESIRYLLMKGRVTDALLIFERLGVKLKEAPKVKVERVEVKEIFTPEYLPRTVLLWTLWFSLVYTYHGIFIWLKAFFIRTSLIVAPLFFYFVVTLAQIPGYFSATFLLDRIGRKAVLELYLTMAGIGCLAYAFSKDPMTVLLSSCIIGFFNLGAWAGLYTYTPELYPTRIRGTGSGTAASFGRFGGFLQGPLTGLVLANFGLSATFIKFMFIHLVAAIAVLLLGVETRGKRLEEISK